MMQVPGISRQPRDDHLRDLERRIAFVQAAFASVGEGIITTNEHGRIMHINPAALRILGFREKEVVGQWFQRILVAVDQNGNEIDLMSRPYTLSTLKKQPISARLYYRTKSKAIVPVAVTVSPIFGKHGQQGTIEVFHDISEELEFDQMKSEFISLASHQLRTPLTAISTYAHMLGAGFQGELNEGQLDFVKTILTSSERMSDLIDTLLSVSRLESGNIAITISEVNVTQVLSKAKQELWPMAKIKSQYLITRSPDDDIVVNTDELLLTEICTNLISNAIKYTPDHGRITVELTRTSLGMKLIVSDTGYGIPAHLQKRVFSKFFRAPNILHAEAVGTGLGLYLVKEIVKALGGTISFRSKEHSGSTFTVELPDIMHGQAT